MKEEKKNFVLMISLRCVVNWFYTHLPPCLPYNYCHSTYGLIHPSDNKVFVCFSKAIIYLCLAIVFFLPFLTCYCLVVN